MSVSTQCCVLCIACCQKLDPFDSVENALFNNFNATNCSNVNRMLFLITKILLNPASILHVLVIVYILLWSLRLFENFLVLFACIWEGSVVCLLNFSFMKVLVIQLNINIDDEMNKNAQINGCVQYHWMILLSHHIFFLCSLIIATDLKFIIPFCLS